MAAGNVDIIKEFLVALGVKIDEAGFKRFNGTLATITRGAAMMGATLLGTAAAIEVFVTKVAHQLEGLYFASQRTGASVENLQAFEFAAKHIGLSAEDARGAVEGLAEAMRSNPGNVGLLNSLGVKTAGRDTMTIFNDLIGRLKQMPFYLAAQYGEMLGIPRQTLFMLMKNFGQLQQSSAYYNKQLRASGVSTGALAKESHDFANVLRDIEGLVGIVGLQIEKKLLPPAIKMAEWVKKNVEWFIALNKEWDGWPATTAAVAVGFTGIGAAVKGLEMVLAPVAAMFAGIGKTLALLIRVFPQLAPLALTGAAGTDQKLGEAPPLNSPVDLKNDPGVRLLNWLTNLWNNPPNLHDMLGLSGPPAMAYAPPSVYMPLGSGGGGVVINQTNNYNLPAGSSPSALERTINRTNADLIRNLPKVN